MDGLQTQKAECRRILRARLKALAGTEEKRRLDGRLAERFSALLAERPETEWVFGYAPLPWEPGDERLPGAVWEAGKRLALPRVSGVKMAFYEVRSFSELTEGTYHILEPRMDCPPVSAESGSLLLIPGFAFTADGKRLGKGGGYYDRFLAGLSGSDGGCRERIGAAYAFQILKTLPAGPLDIPVDWVLTPEGRAEPG